MQLVGQTCVHCRQRVSREAGARVCPQCGHCVHDACARQARGVGGCRACGAPAPPPPPAKSRVTGPAKDRGYKVILLGVGLMAAAIAGSTCAGAATGDGQFALAGVALFLGVVLVLVGSLRNARH